MPSQLVGTPTWRDGKIAAIGDRKSEAALQELIDNDVYLKKFIDALLTWVRSNDVQIKFEESAYSGDAGGDPVEVRLVIADGDGTPDPFSNVAGVTVVADGSATIEETMPIMFEQVELPQGAFEYVAIIHVSDAVAEVVNLSLTDSEAIGLSVADTATVTLA